MGKKVHGKVKIDYDKCVIEGTLKQVRNQGASSELSLVSAWSIKIKPQTSSKVIGLIRELSIADPVPLQHVKRLQKLSNDDSLTVIPCSVQMMSAGELSSRLKEGGIEFTSMDARDVPRHCPQTKELALKWGSMYWPLVWKGNPNDQILAEMEFDMEQIKHNLELITRESQNISTNEKGHLPITTAIVDPHTGNLMSMSSDNRHNDILDHSVMRCINVVSDNEQSSRHGKDPSQYKYLCSGYHVYMTHEPCTMCSMALIHSRVSRLVYLKQSPTTGALSPQSGDGYMIHDHKLLNSKFEVFEWLGEDFPITGIKSCINV